VIYKMAVQFVLLAILCVAIGSSVASNNGMLSEML
jgi:hypothetical protein